MKFLYKFHYMRNYKQVEATKKLNFSVFQRLHSLFPVFIRGIWLEKVN